MAVTVLKNIKEAKNRTPSAHLKNAIRYIMNPKKTEGGLWVGGNVGTDPEQVYQAMMDTKKDFGKLYGRQGYHFVISFAP
ncbi:MAG: relaxase/mobilization nuclease domain-containing protein, partial [Erysipelotrichaceae bacterium]|nr:relaxase/mobilization nuclease domain-containing protein [Erysipelotrichaceae bacterium]